jgi:hypothetical protein
MPTIDDPEAYAEIDRRLTIAEEMEKGLDSYDKWCALKAYLEEDKFRALIARIYNEGLFTPNERKSINKRYKHVDYILKRDETRGTWKTDAAASFVDEADPAEDFAR